MYDSRTMESGRGTHAATRRHPFVDPGLLVVLLLTVAGSAAALSIDVVEATDGVKGDEATYVSMALSAAYDGDLEFESGDLSRFYRIYADPPDGLFLKRGAGPGYEGRLFFGKAYLHAVVAAPFVRLFGINGLLLLNVLLLGGICGAGYMFLSWRAPSSVAVAFTLAFAGASITPLYLVWLTPELLNVALVFCAYFLWLYKEVADTSWEFRPAVRSRWLLGPGSDVAAALLLGLATFSKPPILALACPIVALLVLRRRYVHSVIVGATVLLVAGGAFGLNALVTGELNYQGGDRRTFYAESTGLPFLHGGQFEDGLSNSTNEMQLDEPMDTRDSALVFAHNAGYFLVGRHFGFVPFFFPAVVIVACALYRWRELEAWHVLVALACGGAAIILLVLLPYSWSGGGGPLGNRYYLSFYPAFFFLVPPMTTVRPAVCAWLGGTLFTAHILANPFISSRETWTYSQLGALRLLPVELTMANDLPVNLNTPRTRIPYSENPTVFLYFLDGRTYLPETVGIWVAGGGTSQLIVRTDVSLEALEMRLRSPGRNRVRVAAGGPAVNVDLHPGEPVMIRAETRGVYAKQSWAYLLSIRTRNGFVPLLLSPDSTDIRYLGVQVDFRAVPAQRRTKEGARSEEPQRWAP